MSAAPNFQPVPVDVNTVQRFCELLHSAAAVALAGAADTGLLQISRVHPEAKGINVVGRYEIGEHERMSSDAIREAEAGFNVYVEGRTVRRDTPRQLRGDESCTRGVFALVEDADTDKGRGGTVALQPSLTVSSSPGNFHRWYFLKRALLQAEAGDIGRGLRAKSNTDDDTGNPVQPYRVAGTPNYPDAKKRARGRVAVAETAIVSCGHAYSAAELTEAFGRVQRDTGQAEPTANDDATVALAFLLMRCKRNVLEMLARTDAPDRSSLFHSVVGFLKNDGFTPRQAAALIGAFPESCLVQKYGARPGGIYAEVLRSWPKLETKKPANDDPGTSIPALPTIRIAGGFLADEADEAEAALLESGAPIYRRAGELVRPFVVETASFGGGVTTSAMLGRVNEAILIDHLCRAAIFERYNERAKEYVRTNPPQPIATTILSRQDTWKFYSVAGVISTPTLRPDGSLLVAEGYDADTRLLLLTPPAMPEMAERPSRQDAVSALALLNALIVEFPFVAEADRSVALSAILTTVCRGIASTVPMHVTSAPTAGTGKSYLFDLVSLIATGQKCPVTGFSKSPDENEKRIDGSLLDGAPIICLDNVNGELGHDKLCQAIERPVVEVRRLGASEKQRIDNRSTFFATGNNIQLRGDMTRRAIMARLDAAVERPEMREFRQRPDQIIMADRGRYIAAALTVVRAYMVAGQPSKLPRLGSFETWSDTIRSALVWAGAADPVDTMVSVREEDPELAEREAVFNGIREVFGSTAVTAREIAEAASETVSTDSDNAYGSHTERRHRFPDLHEACLDVASNRGSVDVDRLGKWLRGAKGKVVGQFRLVGLPTTKKTKWAVRPLGAQGGIRGDRGGCFNPHVSFRIDNCYCEKPESG